MNVEVMVIALEMACRILSILVKSPTNASSKYPILPTWHWQPTHIIDSNQNVRPLPSNLIRTLIVMKVLPGSKNSRKPDRRQQAPPPRMPVTKANLTPMESRWLPMKGVTMKATRQFVPMIRP